jgi:hypothetical protein
MKIPSRKMNRIPFHLSGAATTVANEGQATIGAKFAGKQTGDAALAFQPLRDPQYHRPRRVDEFLRQGLADLHPPNAVTAPCA